MERTGELLRKAREEKGLSVHEVSMFLKINTRILQAIEEGNQTNLPAKTFLRGFVQSYAKFLKMDVQEVLQVFSEEMSPHPVPHSTAAGESSSSAPSASSTEDTKLDALDHGAPSDYLESEEASGIEEDPLKNSVLAKASQPSDTLRIRTIAISLVSLLLVFIIYFANSVIKKYQREAELSPDMVASLPVGTQTVSTVVTTPAAHADEAAATSATASAGDPNTNETASQQNSTTTATPTQPTAPSGSDLPTPTPTSAPIPKPQPTATATTNSTPSPTSAPTSTPPTSAPTSAPIPTPTPAAVKPVVTPPAAAVPPKPAPRPAVVTAASNTASATAGSATTTGTARTNSPESSSTPTPRPPEGRLVEVIVEARQNVEIEYSSTRSRPQRLTLRGDQIHTFKSRSGVRLKISNGGAVNVIVNGRDLGVPGVSGQPVQLAYD